MVIQIDNSIKALFGSETRAKILAVLANSPEPKTAYAISKIIEVKPPRVYKELHKLGSTELLGVRNDPSGRRRYFLADEDLRRMLLRRIRLASTDDWFSAARIHKLKAAMNRAEELEVKLPTTRPNPSSIRNREEFVRPPEKDRALKRVRDYSRNRSKAIRQ
jgi:DNA-binding transcriptional ArsR family regulator